MITLTREEAQSVLDALDEFRDSTEDFRVANRCISLIETLRARLSAPEPEPAAWGIANTRPTEKTPLMMVMLDEPESSPLVVPLYTTPPQRNDFNPDWDAMAVMVEEQQRMAKRIEELEAALAQPEPEPVACPKEPANIEELYTAPPQREWQGLTDEEVHIIIRDSPLSIFRAIEAKLKEKNT